MFSVGLQDEATHLLKIYIFETPRPLSQLMWNQRSEGEVYGDDSA